MSIQERISADLIAAQKAKNAEQVNVLRFVLAQIHNRAIALRGEGKSGELNDAQVLEVLASEVKKRKEAINLFKQGQRADLVAKEEKDLVWLKPYLPAEMSSAEIEAVINRLMTVQPADVNSLMREAMKELKGRAYGQAVRAIIEAKLRRLQ